jgi:ABC-type bacteriocin/lantibiotic exporter with double-glycine peptidase domain
LTNVPFIQEPERAVPVDLSTASSAISLKNVTFGYVPNKPILRGLSLEVPVGKKVAIVGGSGSGFDFLWATAK